MNTIEVDVPVGTKQGDTVETAAGMAIILDTDAGGRGLVATDPPCLECKAATLHYTENQWSCTACNEIPSREMILLLCKYYPAWVKPPPGGGGRGGRRVSQVAALDAACALRRAALLTCVVHVPWSTVPGSTVVHVNGGPTVETIMRLGPCMVIDSSERVTRETPKCSRCLGSLMFDEHRSVWTCREHEVPEVLPGWHRVIAYSLLPLRWPFPVRVTAEPFCRWCLETLFSERDTNANWGWNWSCRKCAVTWDPMEVAAYLGTAESVIKLSVDGQLRVCRDRILNSVTGEEFFAMEEALQSYTSDTLTLSQCRAAATRLAEYSAGSRYSVR